MRPVTAQSRLLSMNLPLADVVSTCHLTRSRHEALNRATSRRWAPNAADKRVDPACLRHLPSSEALHVMSRCISSDALRGSPASCMQVALPCRLSQLWPRSFVHARSVVVFSTVDNKRVAPVPSTRVHQWRLRSQVALKCRYSISRPVKPGTCTGSWVALRMRVATVTFDDLRSICDAFLA
jgi:hypothetical protein